MAPRQREQMVGLGGLEPPTSRLSSARSNQLSYKPELSCSPNRRKRRFMGSSFKGRKRNEDGGVPQRRPDWPFDSKNSSRKAQVGASKRKTRRKEVLQPQVPLRLPCYDFTPVADPTVVACLLAVSETPSGRTNSHGVTGGGYKARERINRGVLIRDY